VRFLGEIKSRDKSDFAATQKSLKLAEPNN
jgi:hypothetical protein